MKIRLTIVLSIGLLLLLLASCKKKETIQNIIETKEVPVNNSWRKIPGLAGMDGILFGSAWDSSKYRCVGLENVFTYRYNGVGRSPGMAEYSNYNVDWNVTITPGLVIPFSNQEQVITIKALDGLSTGELKFDFNQFDSTFSRLNDQFLPDGMAFTEFTNSKHIIFPYVTEDNQARALLVGNAVYKLGEFTRVRMANEVKVNVIELGVNGEGNWGPPRMHCMKAVNDGFILAIKNKLVKVDTSGQVNLVLPMSISSLYVWKDTLVAIAPGSDFEDSYFSMDQGKTWQFYKKTNGAGIDFWTCPQQFEIVDNRLVAFSTCGDGYLFEVLYSEYGFSVRRLANDGIENSNITSLTQVNGKVFITSYSGLFRKDVEDFFDPYTW
ncbi:MAG: hypothetical protein ACJAY8_000732 [Sphingobacteriales bacterium]|jgi:hypothetical protein